MGDLDQFGVPNLLPACAEGDIGTIRYHWEQCLHILTFDESMLETSILYCKCIQTVVSNNRVSLLAYFLDAYVDDIKLERTYHIFGKLMLDAARLGYIQVVRYFLQHGICANYCNDFGSTLLIRSVHNQHSELLKCVLDAGVELDTENQMGLSAFKIACDSGNREYLRLLLNHGANIHYKGENQYNDTAILNIVVSGQVELARELIDRGANMEDYDWIGSTCLLRAVTINNLEMVTLLVEKGANIHHIDRGNDNALSCALEHAFEDIAQYLRQHGAILPVSESLSMSESEET